MSTYTSVVLADAPLGFWPLNESTGTTVNDISGNGYNGTYQAGTLAAGTFIDGSPCISSTSAIKGPVLLTSSGFTLNASGFSLEAWVYLTADSVEWEVVVVGGQVLFANPAKPAFQTFIASSSAITAAGNITLNAWNHIVGTANATKKSLYVNGTLRVTGSGGAYTTLAASNNAALGGNPTSTGFGCVGLVANAAVYNSVLTPSQVLNHYQIGSQTGGAFFQMFDQ